MREKGCNYICSCMIFLHPTSGAKLVMKKWIEELHLQPWSKAKKSNDQPAFNWALNKIAGEVCSICLSSLFHSLNFPSNFFLKVSLVILVLPLKQIHKRPVPILFFKGKYCHLVLKINNLEILIYWSCLHNLVDLIVQNMF